MDRQPRSVLIIGSGVFGLGTAWALAKRPVFADTAITVIDCGDGRFPPPDSASVDSSRIVRADYADSDYTALATAAQAQWRKQGDDDVGGQGRYSESGLVLTADRPGATGVRPWDYVQKSHENVVAYAANNGYPADRIRTLASQDAISKHLGTGGRAGDWGYLNTLSGWADAEKGMKWLYERVKATGRVEFVDAKVSRLETRGDRVVGARLADDNVLEGDIVLVAAGAWTGELIDLRGRAEATGHVLGYIDLTDEEFSIMAKQPAVFHMTSGLFIIPPGGKELKAARHDFGYVNPQLVHDALPLSPSSKREPIVISRPATTRDGGGGGGFPAEADADLRRAFKCLAPVEGLESRPWTRTRICWYSDTKDGHWLVDWHPGWKGLFIATGDSGHGFKFLPVLGEKVVDCLLGEGGDLGLKWRWREVENADEGREVNGTFNRLETRDSSRGGAGGMVLEEELRKTSSGSG
ncbi:hypothetical protein CDD83_1450 [Cordyceps sp. RAO-2017]|nr:hypothetical protein CDD83_1450 [Cordyceps sp. RAO-2017]